MGTFHQHRGELHGITVVVETTDGRLAVGRCNTADDVAVALWDADLAPADDPPGTRSKWLERAAQFGIWARHPTIVIPRADVVSLRRLTEVGP